MIEEILRTDEKSLIYKIHDSKDYLAEVVDLTYDVLKKTQYSNYPKSQVESQIKSKLEFDLQNMNKSWTGRFILSHEDIKETKSQYDSINNEISKLTKPVKYGLGTAGLLILSQAIGIDLPNLVGIGLAGTTIYGSVHYLANNKKIHSKIGQNFKLEESLIEKTKYHSDLLNLY